MTAPPDPQLVQQIADAVLAALGARQATPPGHGAPHEHAVPAATAINPPPGTCPSGVRPEQFNANTARIANTADRGNPPVPPAPPVPAVTTSLQADAKDPHATRLAEPPLLTGLVTRHQLDDAVDLSPDGSVYLANAARLTPLAQDRVRREPQRFQRVGADITSATLSHLTHGLPWAWWTCGNCPAVARIVEARRHLLLPLAARRHPDALAQAVLDIKSHVENRRVAGGLLFVANAAGPMLLANRCRALRAAHAHCDQALAQALHAIAPNVLVLEFPYHDHDQMAARVDRIMNAGLSQPDAQVQRLVHAVEGGR